MPASVPTELLREVIREVIREVVREVVAEEIAAAASTSAAGAGRPLRAADSRPTGVAPGRAALGSASDAVTTLQRGALTERHIRAVGKSGSITIGTAVVVTPLAKERAKAMGVEITRIEG